MGFGDKSYMLKWVSFVSGLGGFFVLFFIFIFTSTVFLQVLDGRRVASATYLYPFLPMFLFSLFVVYILGWCTIPASFFFIFIQLLGVR